MSFVRVKPGGWADNETLTSAQQNQLDINVSLALDKTGDTLTGIVVLASGARVDIGNGAIIRALSGGIIDMAGGSQLNVGASAGVVLTGGFLTLDNASTATFGCVITAAAGIASTTGSFSAAVTCSNALTIAGATTTNGALTCNGVVTTNAAVTHAASVSCAAGLSITSGVLDVQSGASLLLGGGSGMTHANLSTQTHANGAIEVHASGSNDTYASGSLLTVAAGAIVAIDATPTFSDGINLATGILTTSALSSSNLGGVITVKGAGNRILMDSRDVTRVHAYRLDRADPTKWSNDPATFDNWRTIALGAQGDIALELPHNCVLKYLSVTMQIGGVHAGFPASLPRWTLFSRTTTTPTLTTLATRNLNAVTDFASNLALYTGQAIAITNTSPIVGVTIDRTSKVYFLRLFTEDGVNALISSQFLALTATYGVSAYDEG